MTKYDAILLIFVLFFTAFAGYFAYREWTDPIIFPGGSEAEPVSTEMESQPDSATSPPVPADAIDASFPEPEPEPEPEPAERAEAVDPEDLQSSIEEDLRQQVGQLAALMESQLSSSLESAQDRISGQSEKLESASRIIQDALDTHQENTRLSVDGLTDTLGLIDEMRDESEDIASGLENARASWDQLFDDVAAIGERSDDRLAEANFEFQAYTVMGAETLSDIARRLETDYNLPESDLSFLLNRFNEIEYRLYDPGGRRPAYRIVANESLRVPVPKTAGTILQDYALPEQLQTQISHINQAASANTSLRKNLSRQVDKLKGLEASVQAITSMSETLRQVDLSTDDPLADNPDLSPEEQEAWRQFESALADYRSASGYEEEQLAQNRLMRSINRILQQYEQDYLEASETEADPLDYYLRFIEKYRPER